MASDAILASNSALSGAGDIKPGAAASGNGAGADADPARQLLEVRGVTIQYRTQRHLVTATYRVGFNVLQGDRFVVLGPSGCGKSTLLKAVGGYLQPTEGEIRLKGELIKKPGPDRIMVFQEFDQLLQWKTVLENVAFPLKTTGTLDAKAAYERAMHYIEMVKPHRIRAHLSAYALRRHEAARRDRARHGDGARYPADGRAVRRARCADAHAHAG